MLVVMVLILDCRRILLVGIQDVKNYLLLKLEETEEEFKQQQQKYNMRIDT